MWPHLPPTSRDPISCLREDRRSYGVGGAVAVTEVVIAAHHQANAVLRILLGEEK
jgi:hypothetical protein